jgi:phosphoribosylglycinamide formyltransferase-1
MAKLAVFASGNGSNFEAIAVSLKKTRHSLEFLLCNKKNAFAIERARLLNIPAYIVSYKDRVREEAEEEILALTGKHNIECIALAGFMKLLSPFFLSRFPGDILNIHPSLLPKFPGVDAIKRSFEAGEEQLGISIISIDHGCDTGPILLQKSFQREPKSTLEEVETRIHALEHEHYPAVVIAALDKIDALRGVKK